ncbi:MAG: YceI family protein [Kofleriaceae bacterium]
MRSVLRSAFAPVVVPVVALIGALVRWKLQGSGNLYTATAKQFWIAHPDFGWTVSDQHPIWLGLEVIAAIAGLVVGLVVAGFVIRWRERKTCRPAKVLRALAWIGAVLPLAVPIAAFASGSGPDHARDTRPVDGATMTPIEAGIAGKIELPAGRYEVVPHPQGSVITAKVKAGGESFTAMFGDPKGSLQLDPGDLSKPVVAEASVATASVDTGISGRSTSARDYLLAAKHPRITWKLDQLVSAKQAGTDQVQIRARGTLGLAGKSHAVEIAGTLKRADADALARLKLAGNVLILTSDFAVPVKETVLASDAKDFDSDSIPIHVSLVLRHTSG